MQTPSRNIGVKRITQMLWSDKGNAKSVTEKRTVGLDTYLTATTPAIVTGPNESFRLVLNLFLSSHVASLMYLCLCGSRQSPNIHEILL